jgi:phage-related protein
MGSTKKDVTAFPDDVKRVMGFCLNKLQEGEFDERIEPMAGHRALKEAKVVEIRDNFDGDTFRTMASIRRKSMSCTRSRRNLSGARRHRKRISTRSWLVWGM